MKTNIIRQTIKKVIHILFLFSIYRSDEEDPSGNKYNRMDDDNIQDKERFARFVYLINLFFNYKISVSGYPSLRIFSFILR